MTGLAKSLTVFVVGLVVAFGLAACDERMPVSTFRSFPETGWERTDTVVVALDSLATPGRYVATVHVRLQVARPYPFQELLLAVERDLTLSEDSLQALRLRPGRLRGAWRLGVGICLQPHRNELAGRHKRPFRREAPYDTHPARRHKRSGVDSQKRVNVQKRHE